MDGDPAGQVVSAGFGGVAEVARKRLRAAGGGALCIYVDGVPVLDIWAGTRDPTNDVSWERDTMAMSWSTTKGIASTVLHMLADRCLIGHDDPIGEYWPEFAVNGKQRTTIRHLMAMEAGLYDIRHLIDDPRTMLDHAAMASALAAATPAHEPGSANGYHAMTYGWIVGELVRRVTGDSLGAFVQSEIVEPLGLDGCYIGTPTDQLARVAAFPHLAPERRAMVSVGKAINPITSLFGVSLERYAAAFLPPRGEQVIPTAEFLQIEAPSVNGVFTARSLARIYAALGSDDGLDGVQLWTPPTRATATLAQNDRRDLVIPLKVRWRLGYHQPFPRRTSSSASFGFYGAFGSGAFADPDRGLAVGLVCQAAKGLPLTKLLKPILKATDHVHR